MGSHRHPSFAPRGLVLALPHGKSPQVPQGAWGLPLTCTLGSRPAFGPVLPAPPAGLGLAAGFRRCWGAGAARPGPASASSHVRPPHSQEADGQADVLLLTDDQQHGPLRSCALQARYRGRTPPRGLRGPVGTAAGQGVTGRPSPECQTPVGPGLWGWQTLGAGMGHLAGLLASSRARPCPSGRDALRGIVLRGHSPAFGVCGQILF